MAEYLFSTNDFNKPTVVTGPKEVAILIFRLILMDPGDNLLHPEMGVGLKTKYAYISTDELSDLKRDIERSISVYLPEYTGTEVVADIIDKKLNIGIRVDGGIYQFEDVLNPEYDTVDLSSLMNK